MPAGLDGNPDPIVTPTRTDVLCDVAAAIVRVDGPRAMVAVDGRSGAGKSTFADELALQVRALGVAVVRSTTDLFHRPRHERMRLGPSSPEGYYLESHQLDAITERLLAPFRAGAESVDVGAFDEPSDQPALIRAEVPERAVLIFDGLFVRRPELHPWWDLTVLLTADRRSDAAWLQFLEHDLPSDPTDRAAELDRRLERARWPRYRAGWQRYLELVDRTPADVVIDNDDVRTPRVLARSPRWPLPRTGPD
jgi:uridine kinase